MRLLDGSYFNLDRRVTLILAVLITLILGGNGVVILEFRSARRQTDRLTAVSQQLITVLRVQESLLSFHQQLNDMARSRDVERLVREVTPLRTELQQQTRQTRNTLAYLPSEFLIDPAFATALNTMETTLPLQLQDITALARAGDWEAVRLRLDNELKRIEDATSALVKSIDRDLNKELPHVVANMTDLQRRILVIVPATAISTVLIAAFFGWAIARRILEVRLEARVHERTRIARDLHDTLLQSFQGVLMKFEVGAHMIPDRPAEAQRMLKTACDQARQAIVEGRDALQGLRSSTAMSNDVARAIRAIGEELAANRSGGDSADFRLRVEGTPRDLTPPVRTEVYRIALEAMRNAFRHADARQIDVEINYEARRLRLKVRDNGKGIDPMILAQGGRAGHHGLPGLQERAKLIGGNLAIRSKVDAGTEVELSVPGSVAFRQSADARSSIASSEGIG